MKSPNVGESLGNWTHTKTKGLQNELTKICSMVRWRSRH